ncbi:hypothetical protein [Pectobacterium versatile]|uniref:hypothetical protein n=1 Tax=Pectobacterium versatile TaxID=2488639 RepID=UPI002B24055D|nr:hypothetical protein [Pectobacterium versatile]
MNNDIRWAVAFLVGFFILFVYIILGFFYFNFNIWAQVGDSPNGLQTIWFFAITLFCILGPIYIPYSIALLIKNYKK